MTDVNFMKIDGSKNINQLFSQPDNSTVKLDSDQTLEVADLVVDAGGTNISTIQVGTSQSRGSINLNGTSSGQNQIDTGTGNQLILSGHDEVIINTDANNNDSSAGIMFSQDGFGAPAANKIMVEMIPGPTDATESELLINGTVIGKGVWTQIQSNVETGTTDLSSFDDGMDETQFTNFKIVINNLTTTDNDSTKVNVICRFGNSSTYIASTSYSYGYRRTITAGSTDQVNSGSTAIQLMLDQTSDNSRTLSGEVMIYNPQEAVSFKNITFNTVGYDTAMTASSGAGSLFLSAARESVQVGITGAANVIGTFTLYGMKL